MYEASPSLAAARRRLSGGSDEGRRHEKKPLLFKENRQEFPRDTGRMDDAAHHHVGIKNRTHHRG
jgi:hypothetical protein